MERFTRSSFPSKPFAFGGYGEGFNLNSQAFCYQKGIEPPQGSIYKTQVAPAI